jgi:O-antigen/teichoic acid export membrane protein
VIDTSSRSDVSRAFGPRASDRNIFLAAKGGGLIFMGTLFTYGCRLVIGILLARFLGAEQYGLYNLTLTAGQIAAGLALLGMRLALVRYISLFASQRDTAGLWGTLQVGLGLPTIMGLLIGIALYALATPIAEQLFHEPRLVPLLRLASLVVPLLALDNILAAATRGFKKMQYTVIAEQISQPMIRLVLIGVLAIVGLNATKAVTAYIVGLIITFAMLLYFLDRLFSLRRPLRTARRDTKGMLRFALPAYLSELIDTFGGSLQTVLLGALNTATTVGIFAVADQVSAMSKMFNLSIGTVSMPIVSELYGRGEREQMARFYQTMTKWALTLNLPVFLTVLLFPGLILAIFGEDFVGGTGALTILAWANLAFAGTVICGAVLNMTGNTSLRLMNSIVVLGLALGLNVLLIPRWGVVGAATAALVGTVVVNLLRVSEVFILFRLLPYNVSFIKPVAAGLVALAAGWLIRQLFHTETNLVYTAINVAILSAVYVGMILLLGLSREDRMVLTRIGRRLGAMLSRQKERV